MSEEETEAFKKVQLRSYVRKYIISLYEKSCLINEEWHGKINEDIG